MRPPPPITSAQVLHEGRGCLADYPMRLQVRGVLTVLALASVPALVLATLTLGGIDAPRAAAVGVAAQSILALASAAERAKFHHWRLKGTLYRWSRQASTQGDMEALALLVNSANSTCRTLWRLQSIAAGSFFGAGLSLCIAPRLIAAIPLGIGILTIATWSAALTAAVHRAEKTVYVFTRDPSSWLGI